MKTRDRVLEQIHLGNDTASGIADVLEISKSTASFHAKALSDSGLVRIFGRQYLPNHFRAGSNGAAEADEISNGAARSKNVSNGRSNIDPKTIEREEARSIVREISSNESSNDGCGKPDFSNEDGEDRDFSNEGAAHEHSPVPRIIDFSNETSLLCATRYYRDVLGWVVHPLHGPNAGAEKVRGKKPLLTGWKKLSLGDITDAFLDKHFSSRAPANVGLVVRAPHLVVDLDSKASGGEAVYRWLKEQTDLAHWPRERTAGGCHLHIYCDDVPQDALEAAGRNQKLTATVADGVTAEIFLGGNVVLAPSMHKSGQRYEWEVTGELPAVPWARLEEVFFGNAPVKAATKSKARTASPEQRLSARFEGDLRTLDIVALCRELGIYGQPISGEEGKHSVRCPWHDQHSDAPAPWSASDSSTVIWEAPDKGFPNFFCSHTSHGRKGFPELLAWAQHKSSGIADRHCHQKRVWDRPGQGVMQPKNKSKRARTRVVLPGIGRLDSDFANEMGGVFRVLVRTLTS